MESTTAVPTGGEADTTTEQRAAVASRRAPITLTVLAGDDAAGACGVDGGCCS